MSTDKKVTDLPTLTSVADDDWLYVVDRSDTSDDPAGSSYKALVSAVTGGGAPVVDVRNLGWSSTASAATNDAALAAAALIANAVIYIPESGSVSAATTLLSNQSVVLTAGTVITQTTASTQIFTATSKDNIWIHGNGGTLVGEGTWSNAWTGVGNSNDRAIEFTTCTNCGVTNILIKDCGLAGIFIEGGDYTLSNIKVIGTHNLSTPITANGNFQMGIFIRHDIGDAGPVTEINCTGFDISDTAQGIVVEAGSAFNDDTSIMNFQGHVHDIPGQHGMYIQAHHANVDLVAENCNLTALKIQGGGNNHDMRGFTFNVTASNCGSQAVEVQNTGTGWLGNMDGTVVAHDCQRGIGISDRVRDSTFRVSCEDVAQHGMLLDGDELHGLNLYLIARNCGRYGFIAQCTNSDHINLINPIIREANDSVGAFDGLYINSATLSIAVYNPLITDANTNQVNGIFVVNGATVGFYGKVVATGASAYGIRANVALDHWPDGATLGGTTAKMLNSSNVVAGKKTPITPQDFGAAGDGVTDDTTPFTDMITAAKGLTAPTINIPQGAYVVTDTLGFDLPDDSTINWYGTISSNVSAKPAIRLGDTASETKRLTVAGGIRVTRTTDDTAGSSRGVEMRRINFGDIRISNCGGFAEGIVVSGEGGGTSHLNIFVNRCHDNQINLLFTADSSGFCNEHSIYGGSYSYSSGYGAPTTAVHLQIDFNSAAELNNIVLHKPSFEGLNASTKVATIHGNNICIIHPRIENSADQDGFEIEFTSNSNECCILGKGFSIKQDNITDGGTNNMFVARDGRVESYQVAAPAGAQPAASDDAGYKIQSTSSNNAALIMGLDASGNTQWAIDASGVGYLKVLEFFGATDVTVRRGNGSPESVVTAGVGSTYHRLDGGANSSLYVKASGSGNTGWRTVDTTASLPTPALASLALTGAAPTVV